MKTTKFVLSILTVFAFAILLTSTVLAADLSIENIVIPSEVNHDAGSFEITFDLVNAGLATTLDWSESVVTNLQGLISFNGDSIEENETLPIIATVTFESGQMGDMAGLIKAIDENDELNFAEFNFDVKIRLDSVSIIEDSQTVRFGQDASITVKNIGDVILTSIDMTEVTSFGAIFLPLNFALNVGAEQIVEIALDSLTGLNFGNNIITIKAEDSVEGASDTATITVEKTFCSNGQIGDLEIKDFDVDNLDGDNDEWEILDEIEVVVEIENNGNEDIDEVELRFGFFDSEGNDLSDDFDWSSTDEEEPSLGDIKDGKDKKHTFEFRVPADFAEFGDDNYMLAIKAFSDDVGEDVECVDSSSKLSDDFFEDISIQLEDEDERFVVVDDIIFNQDPYTCGETVSGEFTVFNIGEDDQEKILVHMKEDTLGIDQEFVITKELEVGEDTTIQFAFELPSNTADDFYDMKFTTEYAYDDGFYDEESEETFIGSFKVIGCGFSGDDDSGSDGNSIITASLDSDAVAGNEMEVTATITNSGNEKATFIVDASGFSSWAELESISPSNIIILESGESKDVTITLLLDEDAEGTESFTIKTTSGSNLNEREMQITIDGSGSPGITGFSIAGLGGSGFVWVLVLINVILIILIIVVAVRISRG